MSPRPLFGVRVPRLCRVRTETDSDEEPFPLDPDGFLDASISLASTTDELLPGMLITPSLAASAGALVLLGEPGVGKTTVFDDLTTPSDVFIDAVRLTDSNFEDLLGRHLAQLPARRGAEPREPNGGRADHDPQRLTIVIDQLDESPMLRRFAAELSVALRGRDTSGLRVLIACRTADYPSELTDVLSSLLGRCVLADLAPLTKSEAIALVGSAGADGEALIESAIAVAAGPLASVPLTLELLVRTDRDLGSLPATSAEVFAHGVRRLAEEHDAERRRDADLSITVEQRVAVAGRVAARLLLAGRRTIWVGSDLDAAPTDVRVGSLVGGTEQIAGDQFSVDLAAVRTTLGSALFTGRSADRLAFRHSSLAAFLAAAYLINRQVPQAQLKSLLLVAAQGDSSTSIPPALRETAAWLAALDPSGSAWLAAADPESLASHSLIVDSPAIRSLVVDSLLAHAPEIELGDYRWTRSRSQLAHPGLATQLATVFSEAPSGEPEDWAMQARVRLATRLAHEARGPGLAEHLLKIAENEAWSPHMRSLAASAAFESAPEVAGARLRVVLDRLADSDHGALVDPDDELRGTLLEMLFPLLVPASDLLVHLRPRRRRNLFGSYALFLRTMTDRLTDEDLEIVLAWAVQMTAGRRSEQDISEATSETESLEEGVIDVSELPVGAVDPYLLESLVDRALRADDAEDRLDSIATILNRRLQRHDSVAIPEALDLLEPDGSESPRSRDLRRGLALALLSQVAATGHANRSDSWHLLHGWSSQSIRRMRLQDENDMPKFGNRRVLVDSGDFAWALEAADAAAANGEPRLAGALGALASLLFDWTDLDAVEIMAGRTQSPAWEYLRSWFEPVVIDSPEADAMREQLRWSRPEEVPTWPEAEQHRATLNEMLETACLGDSTAFWKLVWNLQFDPDTGSGTRRHDDSLLAFPGVAALPANARQRLIEASSRFVEDERDHAETWLGTNQWDKRAWAGYLALALLLEDGSIGNFVGVWERWCGALIWFHAVTSDSGDRDRKRKLLEQAAEYAPRELAVAMTRYVRGELARGGRTWELEFLTHISDGVMANSRISLANEIVYAIQLHNGGEGDGDTESDSPESVDADEVPDAVWLPATAEALEAALDTWATLIRPALEFDERGWELATTAATGALDSESELRLAVVAGRLLLHARPSEAWSILAASRADATFSRALAIALAEDHNQGRILDGLSEDDLAEIYQWLFDMFPPQEDRLIDGAHWVGPEDQARHWRDSVLRSLANRGTDRAVSTLSKLASESPDRLSVRASLVNARVAAHQNAWSPPSPEELTALLTDTTRRLVRSSPELLEVLTDVLNAISAEIPAHGELLWDRIPGSHLSETWRPKPEAALSAYLSHELQLRLNRRGVVVNREILVRPTNAYGAGDRTDIMVEAPLIHDPLDGRLIPTARRAAVVLEVKGSWNQDLKEAQVDQLAGRYLLEANTDTGMYIVGWFPVSLWTALGDSRRTVASRRDRAKLEEHLRTQANEIESAVGAHVAPFLLDVPRPHNERERSG